jgi:hypothetical protein
VELERRMATASAGLRRRRPLKKAALFCVLLVLPLSQRPFARWGHPHPRSDAVSICVVLVRDATHHPCQMVPSKAALMRRATPPAAARGRPQAARRHRVAAACRLLRVVCRTSSAASGLLQLPVVRCNCPSSVATAAGRPLGIRPCGAVAATCIDLVSSAQCFVLEDSAPSRRNPVKSVPLRAAAPIGAWAPLVPHLHRRHLQPPPKVRCPLRTAARRLRQTRVSSSALRLQRYRCTIRCNIYIENCRSHGQALRVA